MNPLIYRGLGKRAWLDKTLPLIEDPRRVVVRITTSTICGESRRVSGLSRLGPLPPVTRIGDFRHSLGVV